MSYSGEQDDGKEEWQGLAGKWMKVDSPDSEGWWECDIWAGVRFRFLDGANPDLGWSTVGFESARDILHLQNADSGPILSSLQVCSVQSSLADNSFLEAARSGKFRNLGDLQFSGGIGAFGIEFLVKAVEGGHLPSLSVLKITNDVRAHSDDIVALAGSLERNGSSLRILSLACAIETGGHLALAQLLESGSLRDLEELRIAHSAMDEESWKAYSRAMSSGSLRLLKVLEFRFTGMGNRAAELFASGLRSGNVTRLKGFSLLGNEVGDDGIHALVSVWTDGGCRELEELDLASNPLGETGFASVSDALKSGQLNSLRTIRISVPSKDCAKKILSAFASNHLLTARVTFILNYNDLNFELHDLNRQLEYYRNRNLQLTALVEELGANGELVKATNAKVYLCGNSHVGKTTLLESLQRPFLKAMMSQERRQHLEDRTVGISIARVEAQDKDAVSLAVWDMAGQENYHLLHHACFQELASGDGSETSFVFVCNSKQSKEELTTTVEYWMRCVASSSTKGADSSRTVFAVLNLHNGKSLGKVRHWKNCIDSAREKYDSHLKISEKLFIKDVRKRRYVKGLKTCLLEHSMLERKLIPDVCFKIENAIKQWVDKNRAFPVLPWETLVSKVKGVNSNWSEEILHSAMTYLNETGVLIYIANSKTAVLDPDWICSKIVGEIFRDRDPTEDPNSPYLFRTKVDRSTGSVHISELKKFFKMQEYDWKDSDLDVVVSVLLWLGLCYKGKDNMLFIPALITVEGTRGDCWEPCDLEDKYRKSDWVMGFAVQPVVGEVHVGTMTMLWLLFQVTLGNRFGDSDEAFDHDFSAGKSFVVFKENRMAVRIEVDRREESPTFWSINFYVKPIDCLANTTPSGQIDLANDLVEILLKLWSKVCRGIGYVHRVVWPWPAGKPIEDEEVQERFKNRNLKVSEVRKLVLENGMGIEFPHWRVGRLSTITYDQLLSNNDLMDILKSWNRRVEEGIRMWNDEIKERVNFGILGKDGLKLDDVVTRKDHIRDEPSTSSSNTFEVIIEAKGMEGFAFSDPWKDLVNKQLSDLSSLVRGIGNQLGDKFQENQTILHDVRSSMKDIQRQQGIILQNVQGFERIFVEDKEKRCPRLIYLGECNSREWVTLKGALSGKVNFRAFFFCELEYNEHGQKRHHEAKNQQGVEISTMKDWAQVLAPWLVMSLTVLSMSAKVAANFARRPGFEASFNVASVFLDAISAPLQERIEKTSGFTLDELQQLMNKGQTNFRSAHELYGSSIELMTSFLKDLSISARKSQVGLQKVSLKFKDGSNFGPTSAVAWVCLDCIDKYRKHDMVTVNEFHDVFQ